MTRSVVIVQRVMPHYRVAFFEGLRTRLAIEGIELRVVHGQPDPTEAQKNDQAELSFANVVRNRYLKLGRRYLCWQPVRREISGADLVVVEQASRLIYNYVLLARRLARRTPRIAFWGHGRNLDARTASRPGEAAKRFVSRRVDWWFAYTSGTADVLNALGIDTDRITVVQNAVDTVATRELVANLDPHAALDARVKFGLESGPIGLVLGSLYSSKRLDFVIEAADVIRAAVPEFQLLVIGDGPDGKLVADAARSRNWIIVAGALRGEALVRLAAHSAVTLNPGLVGLGVIDAFALSSPVVVCELSYHSPEIDYVVDGVNGVRLPGSTTPRQYANAVVQLLLDSRRRSRLVDGCNEAAARITIQEMVERFSHGVVQALAAAAL